MVLLVNNKITILRLVINVWSYYYYRKKFESLRVLNVIFSNFNFSLKFVNLWVREVRGPIPIIYLLIYYLNNNINKKNSIYFRFERNEELLVLQCNVFFFACLREFFLNQSSSFTQYVEITVIEHILYLGEGQNLKILNRFLINTKKLSTNCENRGNLLNAKFAQYAFS